MSASDTEAPSQQPSYGETWVYESLVGAVPGLRLPAPVAVGVQFCLFEAGILLLAGYYGLWRAAVAGTVAVAVAAVGSVAMLTLSRRIRALDAPRGYRHLLFGSSIEVAMGVVAFVALVTYLFVVDPQRPGTALLTDLFGPQPPAPVVFLTLLVLWDLCYRIGTGWWASVVALWRSIRFVFPPETAGAYRRVDLTTLGFALVQLALLPFVTDHPVLVVAVGGHVIAVGTVVTLSVVALGRREKPLSRT
jgi:hypothetical protein